MKKIIGIIIAMGLLSSAVSAMETVKLPKPNTSGGKPLMETMSERRTSRDFNGKEIDNQTLSEILWSAYGVSHERGLRTIPTSRNQKDLEVYVIKKDGAWHYDADDNVLHHIADKDLFPLFATQDFMKDVPVILVYTGTNDRNTTAMHAGSAYQNVGLYCASKGLKNVVRGLINHDEIAKALGLKKGHQVIVSQAVGW